MTPKSTLRRPTPGTVLVLDTTNKKAACSTPLGSEYDLVDRSKLGYRCGEEKVKELMSWGQCDHKTFLEVPALLLWAIVEVAALQDPQIPYCAQL